MAVQKIPETNDVITDSLRHQKVTTVNHPSLQASTGSFIAHADKAMPLMRVSSVVA